MKIQVDLQVTPGNDEGFHSVTGTIEGEQVGNAAAFRAFFDEKNWGVNPNEATRDWEGLELAVDTARMDGFTEGRLEAVNHQSAGRHSRQAIKRHAHQNGRKEGLAQAEVIAEQYKSNAYTAGRTYGYAEGVLASGRWIKEVSCTLTGDDEKSVIALFSNRIYNQPGAPESAEDAFARGFSDGRTNALEQVENLYPRPFAESDTAFDECSEVDDDPCDVCELAICECDEDTELGEQYEALGREAMRVGTKTILDRDLRDRREGDAE